MGEAPRRPVERKNVGGKKKGPGLDALIDTTVVGLFSLTAIATAHEHWLKDREEVFAITGPLKAWVDQLPAKTLKKVEQNLTPALFLVGCATVVGPDILLEMRLRADAKRTRIAVQQTATGGFRPGIVAPPDGGGERNPLANGSASSAGGWASSIPAAGPLGSEHDV